MLSGSELLDSIGYVSGDLSEKIVMEGRLYKGVAASCVINHRFEASFTTSTSWGEVDVTKGSGPVSVAPGVWLPTGAQVLEYWSEPSGWLKVELWIHINDFCGTFNTDAGWHLAARDDAHVRFGGAEVSFSRGQYEVGETAEINYKIGYARSAKTDSPGGSSGWSAALYSHAAGSVVRDWTLPGPDPGQNTGFAQGTLSYTVQASDFRSGGCSAGSQNYLEITLYNNLVFTEEKRSTVIDQRALAPPAPTISLDKPEYVLGDSMSITVTAQPNSETGETICGIKLTIFYEEGGIVLLEPKDLSGNEVTYIYNSLPDDGTVSVEAWSYDTGGRPSDIAKASVRVRDPASTELIDITLVAFIMVALIVIGIVILLPLPYLNAVPLNVRGIISTVLIGSAVGLFIYFVLVPILIQNFCWLLKPMGVAC
jgi:hypothetical protein